MANILISLLEGELVGSTLDIIEETGGELEIHVRRVYVPVEVDIVEETGGDLTAAVRSLEVPAEIDVTETFGGELNITVRGEYDIDIREYDGGELNVQARLSLEYPPPIINEIPANWLQHQTYQVRMTDDLGRDIRVMQASVRANRQNLAEEASVTLATADWPEHTSARRYTLEIGLRNTPMSSLTWHTVLYRGELIGEQFTSAYNDGPDDLVTLSLVSTWQERIIGWRTQNVIIYDPTQTTVALETLDTIYYENGSAVQNVLNAVPGLTLYKLLKILYSKTTIVTNIPNFPLIRVDVPVTQGIFDVVSQVVGLFDPIWFYDADDDTLYILNKHQELPDDLTIGDLTADEYTSWDMTVQPQDIDGFTLTYTENIGNWALTAERVVTMPPTTSGTFGTPDFTQVTHQITYKDWKDSDGKVIRSEPVKDVKETFDWQNNKIGETENVRNFDGQGKLTDESNRVTALLPNVTTAGNSLQDARLEETRYEYANDPRSPRNIVQTKMLRTVRGLIVTDPDDEYLGQPVKMELLRAHDGRRVVDSMTVSSGLIETQIDTLTNVGGNQYQMWSQTIDHLTEPVTVITGASEARSGDPTASRNSGKRSRQVIVLRSGLTPSGRANPVPKPIPTFAVGELPLALALPLCRDVLAATIEGRFNANAVLGGWHPAMQKGLLFNAKDRAGADYGIFITEGWTLTLENLGTPEQFVSTTLEIAQVKRPE